MARRLSVDGASSALLEQRTIAVCGYGNQGRAQALNLRDSGVNVLIGQRPGASYDLAMEDGFEPLSIAEATQNASIIMLTLPDETMAGVFEREVNLAPGSALLFSHGFNLHFGLIRPPADVDVILVSPKAQARGVRDRYLAGHGVPALIGISQDFTEKADQIALGYAAACGYTRSLLLETTFREETETDLFGEQAVLCGGMIELIKLGFEVLVTRGYDPEMAYFECVHETKLIVDLLVERGLSETRRAISDTAEWGGFTVGPRLVTAETRAEMERALDRIQSGEFAHEWIKEARDGKPRLNQLRLAEASHGVQLSFDSLWG